MAHSKSAISPMHAGCANGILLPLYVCYKADHIHQSWTTSDPQNGRYNQSACKWFDMATFEDWFNTLAFPHLKLLKGKKVMKTA